MPIDDCKYTFEALSSKILPGYMRMMRKAMKTPVPTLHFAETGIGMRTLLKRHSFAQDFSGCYVLMDGSTPKYVGISRYVIRRIMLHVRGKTHYDANLAYLIASRELHLKLPRQKKMEDKNFLKEFEKAVTYLRSLRTAFIPIKDPVELYLFEVYCALKLDTEWNTFRTH